MKSLLVALSLASLFVVGCAKAGPLDPPQAKSDLIRQIAINAHDITAYLCGTADLAQPCAPNTIDTKFAHEVMQDTLSVADVAGAGKAGWQAAVKSGWTEALVRIGDVQNERVKVFLAVVTAAVEVL